MKAIDYAAKKTPFAKVARIQGKNESPVNFEKVIAIRHGKCLVKMEKALMGMVRY